MIAGSAEPQSIERTLTLWAISMFFELVIPELVIGVIGHAQARQNEGKTGSMITVVERTFLEAVNNYIGDDHHNIMFW